MYVVRIEALDDLAGGGCPMCRAVDRVERAWLLGLLDEVGDAKVRSALERGGGLCAAHVRLLVEVATASGKTLGLGVVLEVLLSQARDELGSERPAWRAVGSRLSRGLAARVEARRGTGVATGVATGEGTGVATGVARGAVPHGAGERDVGCGACSAARLRERAYTEVLLAAGDTSVRRRAEDPRSALCRPHLAGARAARLPTSSTVDLDGAARTKVDELLAAVARSIAAHAVGSESGPDAHEVILRDAPDWLAGRAGESRRWVPGAAARRSGGVRRRERRS